MLLKCCGFLLFLILLVDFTVLNHQHQCLADQVKFGPIREGRWETSCLHRKDGFYLGVIHSVFVENMSSKGIEFLVKDHTTGSRQNWELNSSSTDLGYILYIAFHLHL